MHHFLDINKTNAPYVVADEGDGVVMRGWDDDVVTSCRVLRKEEATAMVMEMRWCRSMVGGGVGWRGWPDGVAGKVGRRMVVAPEASSEIERS
nr:hypothetical protein [Tanacetum cinerariifolium]